VLTFGPGFIGKLESVDGKALRFTIPEGIDVCPPDSLQPCVGAYPRVRPGEYAITVIVSGEKSNGLTFTVTQK
jgi:hypothetical protein